MFCVTAGSFPPLKESRAVPIRHPLGAVCTPRQGPTGRSGI